jgi:hypothetical protein
VPEDIKAPGPLEPCAFSTALRASGRTPHVSPQLLHVCCAGADCMKDRLARRLGRTIGKRLASLLSWAWWSITQDA